MPTAVWAYGAVRMAAFAAPMLAAEGGVGLGAVIVAVLFIFLVAGRRWAWVTLVVLDALTLTSIAATAFRTDTEVPWSVPLLTATALSLLLLPSVRRFVGPRSATSD